MIQKEIIPGTQQSLHTEPNVIGPIAPGPADTPLTGMAADHQQRAPEMLEFPEQQAAHEQQLTPEQPSHTVLFDFSGNRPTMLIDGRTITELELAEICALRMLLLMYPNDSVISSTDLWDSWIFTDYATNTSKVFQEAFGNAFTVRNILNVLVPKLQQLDIPGLSFESIRGGGIAVHNPYKDLVQLSISKSDRDITALQIETVSAPINSLQKEYIETLLASYSETPGTWLTAEEILQKLGKEVTAHTVGGVLKSLRTVGGRFYSGISADTVGINYNLIIQIWVEKTAGKYKAFFRINPQIQVQGAAADLPQ
jgi:hypothetical protein